MSASENAPASPKGYAGTGGAEAGLKLAFAALLLSGLGLWFADVLPLAPYLDRVPGLQIEEVQIHASWPLDAKQIQSWLPPLQGRNIVSVRAARLIELLERKPWVETVTIKKEYPNRLTLEVTPRKAEAISIQRGLPYFLDGRGQTIERVKPEQMRAMDLPVISFDHDADAVHWPASLPMRILGRLALPISQLALGSYPYFRIYLSRPNLEVTFNVETWESQLPILTLLLRRPPDALGQPKKISLVFPKKAVVSHPLSK
jgi:hypothetical protein